MPNLAARLRRLPLLQRLVPTLLKAAARGWPGGFRVLDRRGARFLLNYRNFVDRQIAFYDDFEDAQLERFFSGARRLGCSLFLDVGANMGYYSVLAATALPEARIVAFEPDRRNHDQLRANLFLNGLSDRIETRFEAVSEQAGTLSFEPASDGFTGRSMVSDSGARTVQAVRLDDLFALSDAAIAVKIDIEGHEASALRGMSGLLRANRCFLQIEVFAEHEAEVAALMAALGYRSVGAIGFDRYFTNAADDQPKS